jgi:hypothetical protein
VTHPQKSRIGQQNDSVSLSGLRAAMASPVNWFYRRASRERPGEFSEPSIKELAGSRHLQEIVKGD